MSNPPAAAGGPTSRSRRRGAPDRGLGAVKDSQRALYHCNYCQKDISCTVRIKCAICPDFDLCIECFSVGVELKPHRSHHAYRVVDHLGVPLYHPAWKLDEDLLLLEGLEMFGMGSWASVGDHVGTKTAEECRDHYFRTFVDSPSFPLPCRRALVAQDQQLQGYHPEGSSPAKHEGEANGLSGGGSPEPSPLPAQGGKKRVPPPPPKEEDEEARPVLELERSFPEAAAPKTLPGKVPVKLEVPEGGAPDWPGLGGEEPPLKRHRHVEVGPSGGLGKGRGIEDAAGSRGVAATGRNGAATRSGPRVLQKAAAADQLDSDKGHNSDISGYHAKRHEFEPEYDNDAEVPIADLDFRPGEPEEEQAAKLQLLHIYNRRLDERQRRRDFIFSRGLLNVRRQQALEKKQGPMECELAARLRVFARYCSNAQMDALADSLLLEQRLRARIRELKCSRRLGCRTLAEVDALDTGLEPGKRASSQAGAASSRSHRPQPLPAAMQMMMQALPAGMYNLVGAAAAEGVGQAAALQKIRNKRAFALDITGLPGLELLSAKERELCASVRLLPCSYLAMKQALMNLSREQGGLVRAELKSNPQLTESMDITKLHRVFDLLVQCGWLQWRTAVARTASSGALLPPPPDAAAAAAEAAAWEDTASEPAVLQPTLNPTADPPAPAPAAVSPMSAPSAQWPAAPALPTAAADTPLMPLPHSAPAPAPQSWTQPRTSQ